MDRGSGDKTKIRKGCCSMKKAELLILLLLLAGLLVFGKNLGKQVSSSAVIAEQTDGQKTEKKVTRRGEGKTVVLDPGHGGNDPGKVGANSVKEKDVNLQIAMKTKKLLEKEGVRVIMTRDKDQDLAGDSDHNRKVQDMKARVKLINDAMPALTVSIHQNSYQDPAVKGAQVFYYSHSKEAERAAEILKQALLTVEESGTREKKAADSYYLLKKTEVPVVIVECGFLSNPEEAKRLADSAYQKELAKAVAKGILTCLNE